MLDAFYDRIGAVSPVALTILSVALMLFFGFAMTRVTKPLRLPSVTAYIAAGILIGPYDLSCSMGHPGEWDNPEVTEALDTICSKTRAAGILLGAYAEADLDKYLNTRKIQYIACINDTGALMSGYKAKIAEVRQAAGN